MSNDLIYTLIGEAELPQIEQIWADGVSDEVFAPFFACFVASLADDEMSAWYRSFVKATDTAYGTAIATGSPLVGGQVYWHKSCHTALAEQIAQATSVDKALLQVAFPLATHAGYDYLVEQADLAGVSLQEYAKSKLPTIATALPTWAEACVPFGVLSQVSVDSLVNKALQSDLGIDSSPLNDDVFLTEHLEIPDNDDFVLETPTPQAVVLDEIELSPDDFILETPSLPSLQGDVVTSVPLIETPTPLTASSTESTLGALDIDLSAGSDVATKAVLESSVTKAPIAESLVVKELDKEVLGEKPPIQELPILTTPTTQAPAKSSDVEILGELELDFSLTNEPAKDNNSKPPMSLPSMEGLANELDEVDELAKSPVLFPAQDQTKVEQALHRQDEARAFAVLDNHRTPEPASAPTPTLDLDDGLVVELEELFDKTASTNQSGSSSRPAPIEIDDVLALDDVLSLDPSNAPAQPPAPSHLESLILNQKEKVRVTAQLEATKSQVLDGLSHDKSNDHDFDEADNQADEPWIPHLHRNESDEASYDMWHKTPSNDSIGKEEQDDDEETARPVSAINTKQKLGKKSPKAKKSGNGGALKIALPVLLLLLAGGGGFWYYQNHLNVPAPEPAPVAVVAETPAPPLPVQSLPPSNLSLTVDDAGNLYACRAELGNDGLMQQVYGLLQANFVSTVCAMDINAGVSQNMTGLEKLTSVIGLLKTSPFASLELSGETLYIHSPNPDEITRLVNDMGALMAGVVQVVARPPLNASVEISQSLEKANTALNNLAQNADAHQLARAMSLPIFDLSGGAVPENLMPFLSLSAERLKTKSDIRLIVVVHSDDTGDKVQARQATKQQAELIKKTLVGMGVSDFQLVAQGVGYDFPLMDNQTELGRFKNRRVEFLVYDDAVFNALNAPAVPPPAPVADTLVNEPAPAQNTPQNPPQASSPESLPMPSEMVVMPSGPIPPAYDVVGGQIVEQGLPQVNPNPLPSAQFAPIREQAPPPASGDIDDDLLRPIGSDMGNGMATPVQ